MTSNNYLPNGDAKFATWLANFNTVAGANATTLGLTPADLLALGHSLSDLNDAMGSDTAARAASKSATATKNVSRKSGNATVRKYVRSIQGNANVPDSLRQALGIPVRKTPAGPIVPVTPASLVAVPDASGVNTLQWKPGGNTPGAVYVVEAASPANGAWTQVGVSTKTRFAHEGVTPGQPLMYRVWAQRGDMQSAASNQAIVYGG